MDSLKLNFKKKFLATTINKTLVKGNRIILFVVAFYFMLGIYGKLFNSIFEFNSIAYSGVIPSLLFLILWFTWFKTNKNFVLHFFALSYLGIIYTLTIFLYLIFTNNPVTENSKYQIIILFIIVLFTQSILALGIRKYIHLLQIIPILIVFIFLGVSEHFNLNVLLFILNIPVVIIFLYFTNRLTEKNMYEEFCGKYKIEISESKLINEIGLRKRAEEKLKQHDEKLKQIVEERTNHITEKNLELEAAKSKAEESDRLKTAFMATMSHELRTPLNAIIGFTELMDEETSRHEFIEFKDIINKSGIRLLTTVEDIFQLTYIETNDIILHNEKFNLNGFIQSLLDNYEDIKENFHKAYLNLNFKPGLDDKDCFVYSDPKRLKIILDKLVNNAIKFTKIGAIEIGYEYATSGKYKDYFIFHVKDTGIGIPTEFHETIFDRFRQVEETNTRNYEGSGLGVTIAKELSKLLGGDMWVESELEKGSTFFFALPIETHMEKLIEKEPNVIKKTIPNFSSKRILIAEDTESNFKLLEHYLKKTNIEIIWALDGLDAVEFCKQDEKIDLILMDMKMPNMNGYEASMEIKKLGLKCPIVAQTAYALQDDEVKTFTAGCDDYLSKPIKAKDLYRCIGKYLTN